MSIAVVLVVLAGALLHASANTIVKRHEDPLTVFGILTLSGGLVAAPLLYLLPPIEPRSVPMLFASTALQVLYYRIIAQAFRIGELSKILPVARGIPPLLTAGLTSILLGANLSAGAWSGIVLVSAGASGIIFDRSGQPAGRAVLLALAAAAVVASYTVIDGIGARRSASPISYTVLLFLLTGIALTVLAVFSHGWSILRLGRHTLLAGTIAGLASVASYGSALWAMTLAPIAIVAALRETSILFATILSVLILKEVVSPLRLAGSGSIFAGAALLAYLR